MQIPKVRGLSWTPVETADLADRPPVSYAQLWGEEVWVFERHFGEGADDFDYSIVGATFDPVVDPTWSSLDVAPFATASEAEQFVLGLVYDGECQFRGERYTPTKVNIDPFNCGGEVAGKPNVDWRRIAEVGGATLYADTASGTIYLANGAGNLLRVFSGKLPYTQAVAWAVQVVGPVPEDGAV